MKKCLQISLLSSLLVLPTMAVLAADATATTATNANAVSATTTTAVPAMSMMDVLTKLDAAGYHAVKEVDLGSNGTYKVETIDAKGAKVEFTVDPAKPVIAAQPQGTKILTATEVAKKVMDAGYMNITKIKFKGDSYSVKAHDKQGKNVELDVNLVTGEITKDWF
jgi:hypothetical protein